MSAEHPLRMNAYYYGFTPTGVIEIDRILSAVATAGKHYHHTEMWSDSDSDEELSEAEEIQAAAEAAAEAFRRAARGGQAVTDLAQQWEDEAAGSLHNKRTHLTRCAAELRGLTQQEKP